MTFEKLSKEIQTLNADVQKLTEKQLQLVIKFAEVKRTHNDNKDNVVGLNEYQQRINKNPVGGGWYHFYGVPKNEEGKLFISLIDKYLNRNVYGYRARGRGNGSYSHSLPSDQADSFVVYLDEKKKI
tara:strand:- start:6221 stop:6601 length:381 start_codon:yes stop_codon:yes gene_type:complete